MGIDKRRILKYSEENFSHGNDRLSEPSERTGRRSCEPNGF